MKTIDDLIDAWLKKHGAESILLEEEVDAMRQGAVRVLKLMADLLWHSAIEINLAAGQDGIPASEGLRRMRDLRPALMKHGYVIEKKRSKESRVFSYRIVSA